MHKCGNITALLTTCKLCLDVDRRDISLSIYYQSIYRLQQQKTTLYFWCMDFSYGNCRGHRNSEY